MDSGDVEDSNVNLFTYRSIKFPGRFFFENDRICVPQKPLSNRRMLRRILNKSGPQPVNAEIVFGGRISPRANIISDKTYLEVKYIDAVALEVDFNQDLVLLLSRAYRAVS
jgi:hypothetical protein